MRPIAYDMARMLCGFTKRTPRGIDRVDLGYAEAVFSRSDAVGIVPSPFGPGLLTGREARGVVAATRRHWSEDADPAGPPPRGRPWQLQPRLVGAFARDLGRAGCQRAARRVPQGAIYLNVGQTGLTPRRLAWLEQRSDVKPVFLIHDVIPLSHPEYTSPRRKRLHEAAVASALRQAALIIVTSSAVAADMRHLADRLGHGEPAMAVVALPVADALLRPAAASPALRPPDPYFVVVGAIDLRKNHLMLLQVWRDMVRSPGTVPTLVILGPWGSRSAEVATLLARNPGLARHCVHAADLPSPQLRHLIRGARALLMPSLAEGFGLPIIEALALGTPVIASSLPVHREVGGAWCTYLDPLDGVGWAAEIGRRARETAAELAERRAALGRHVAKSWGRYFEDVTDVLATL